MTSSLGPQFLNWPDSLESKIPYKKPPKGSNPAINGAPLAAAAPLVEKLSFVATFLYKNAGFGSLRKVKELEDIKHRFDPTVIPVVTEADRSASLPNHTDPALEIRSLLKKAEGTAPLYWSTRDYHEAYKKGDLTPLQVINGLLPVIRRDIKNRSEHSTSFLTTQVDIVIKAAEESTKRWAEGKPRGLLDGVPIAMKDELDLAGYPQYLGSKKKIRDSKETSWCVLKWEEAGAIVVGKTNMHEIGMDTTNNNFTYGTPLNPYNDRYYTGGSSGGSGYAVSTGLVPFALGTDGGGSVRLPSCYCGTFGLKTSHSRVSERPSPDIAGTTAVAGPIASSMEDLEIAYHVMATPDPLKSASASFPTPRRLPSSRKKIIGIPRQWFDQSDEFVRNACQKAIDWYAQENGYEVVDIHIPLTVEGQLAHALTIMLEAKNGFPDTKFLQPANRILMALANHCPTTDFLCAQKVRQIIMQHLGYLFDTHGKDLIIVTPTTPNAGWSFKPADLKKGVSDGDMTIRNMTYVWLANFCGNPALTFPVAFAPPKAGKGNVPVGLMGMGIWGGEEGLIEWGYEGERYLHEVLEGGRLRSPKWLDVMKLAKETNEKPAVAEVQKEHKVQTNGTQHQTNGSQAQTNGAAHNVTLTAAAIAPAPGASTAVTPAPLHAPTAQESTVKPVESPIVQQKENTAPVSTAAETK